MSTTGLAAPLRLGTCLDHDGARFEVVEIAGRRLVLRQVGTGGIRQVDLAWLLAHPSARIADAGADPVVAAAVVLAEAEQAEVAQRAGHVREVLTGYRRGSAEVALPGEPRPAYRPGTPMMGRYAAKAAEIGVSVPTLRRWVCTFQAAGPAGLVRHRTGPRDRGGWGRTDARWMDMCRTVVAEHVTASRPTRALILAEVETRLVEEYGEGVVAVPAKTVGYELLAELFRGSNAFTGSTKGKRLANPTAQASAHGALARAYIRLGNPEDAGTHLRHALDLYREAGDQVGHAHTHHSLARVWERRGRYVEALDHARQALDLYRAADHRRGQARALNSIGWYLAQLGDHQQALTHCHQALTLHEELGNRDGQASTWDSLGYIHHQLGRHTEAIACYQHGLDLIRILGDRYNEAGILTHLGDTHHSAGHPDAARTAWRQALTILEDLDHPDADTVRAKLHRLDHLNP